MEREAIAEVPEPKAADSVVTVIPMAATAPTLVPLAHAVDTIPDTTDAPVHNDDFAAHHTGTIDGTPIESVNMHEQIAHDIDHLPDGDSLADAPHFGH